MDRMNPKPEQIRTLSDDILCADEDDSQSEDFRSLSSLNDMTMTMTTTTTSTTSTSSATNTPPPSLMTLGGLGGHSAQGRRGLVHSVSIIVEPAIMDDSCDHPFDAPEIPLSNSERRKTIAGPIVLLEDFYIDQPKKKKAKEYDDIVQSLFASARLRKEEFARLLEEHAELVHQIKKAETNLL